MKESHQSLCSLKLSWEYMTSILVRCGVFFFFSKALSNSAHLEWIRLSYIQAWEGQYFEWSEWKYSNLFELLNPSRFSVSFWVGSS